MNEIERAIELLEEISYNMGLERDTEYAGDAEKFHSLCDKKGLIDLATDLCRAELSRQENAPLTEDELPSIIGKPYYHVSLESDAAYWRVFANEDAAKNPKLYHYGERWLAYRHEPKGEKE